MRKHSKKLTALLLTVCLLLGLAACGGSGGEDKKGDAAQISGTVYVPEFMDLDLGEDVSVTGGCCDGTNVYLVADASVETEVKDPDTGETTTVYSSKTSVYKMPLDGGEMTELENYEPSYSFDSYDDGWFNLDSIRVDADGSLWVSERADINEFNPPEGFDPEKDDPYNYLTSTSVELERKLDATGKEIDRVDVSGLEEKLGGWIYRSVIDGNGNIYASGDAGISVLDRDMNPLFDITEEAWGDLVLLGDGTVGVMRYAEEGRSVQVIDLETKGWGKSWPIQEASANSLSGGSGEYLFYYECGDALYGYKAETESSERLLSWNAADINSDYLVFFTFLADGRVAAMTQEWGMNGRKVELAVLTEQDASVLSDKTILTYATMYLDQETRTSIIDFNRSNTKYRIEIKDYSEYNTSSDYTAGLTKLNTEIVAGNVPDLLDVEQLPLRQYGAKGILEDLWPYIDNDPDIGREDLMERVLTAAEQDGKLYQIFDSFVMATVIGSTDIVGDKMGWTLAELKEALTKMPEGATIFGDSDTKENILQGVLTLNLDSYVNWEKGECYFDSDSFKSFLEFCNSFPAEYTPQEEGDDLPTRISSGRQMLDVLSLDGFGDFQVHEAMFGGADALKTITYDYGYSGSSGYAVVVNADSPVIEEGPANAHNVLVPGRYVTFKGFPMEDGSCGSTFGINRGMAMSSTCKDKEGAWSFMRQFLLPDGDDGHYAHTWGFPINKADFERKAAESMEVTYITDREGKQVLDDNGEPIQKSKGGWTWGSLDMDLQATTQEEYDQIMELYNTIDSMAGYDSKIAEIVVDVAGGYFAGDITLDEAASRIQSRVNLYVNETL